eukprot:CAMPEP_0202838280 /NCGR_PEP_ID=MMETSP1389-20130828/48863_1 /ASSEMBLY_ACC=CAM_ASM_000865 /TAXON_ID=302021 /ORGANISM="Rhodomonas sp., Strain CCMP768" /LENGTH=61 /DNA_ID=CAMNT_0049514523 /DNA_START=104 /DNA_END=286 /DNA_ORIENTATION=+
MSNVVEEVHRKRSVVAHKFTHRDWGLISDAEGDTANVGEQAEGVVVDHRSMDHRRRIDCSW